MHKWQAAYVVLGLGVDGLLEALVEHFDEPEKIPDQISIAVGIIAAVKTAVGPLDDDEPGISPVPEPFRKVFDNASDE